MYLGDLTQCPALFPEVNYHTTSAVLCLFNGLFDTENEVGTTCANVGTEYIASIALGQLEYPPTRQD